jgi:ribosomal protein L35
MPKHKPTKGLLKRIRITGKGKVKFQRAAGRHKRSHKSGERLQTYRDACYARPSDRRRIEHQLHCRIQPVKAKCDQKKCEAAEAKD